VYMKKNFLIIILFLIFQFYCDGKNPVIIMVNPLDNSVGISIDTDIRVQFDQEMDETTLNNDNIKISDGINAITGSNSYNKETFTWIITLDILLENNTTYTVIISSGVKDIMNQSLLNGFEWKFTTIGNTSIASDPVVIYGDSRTNHYVHQNIVNAIIEIEPDLVFHTGDLVGNGAVSGQWDIFNDIVSNLLSIAEFYPALGNHENNSQLYFDNFNLPNNERWYFIEYNDIHYIVLDSNSKLGSDSEQYEWLEHDLQNISNNINFIVVIFHHPIFSTGLHFIDQRGLKDILPPLFEKYNVDIVFNGHAHNYERSQYNNIYYITTGGGGAPLYPQVSTSIYSQKFIVSYHFCKLTVIDNRLVIEALSIDLKSLDRFEIE